MTKEEKRTGCLLGLLGILLVPFVVIKELVKDKG